MQAIPLPLRASSTCLFPLPSSFRVHRVQARSYIDPSRSKLRGIGPIANELILNPFPQLASYCRAADYFPRYLFS